jgi:hypothetical protein
MFLQTFAPSRPFNYVAGNKPKPILRSLRLNPPNPVFSSVISVPSVVKILFFLVLRS